MCIRDRCRNKQERKKSLAVSIACMAIYWPTSGFKGRTFKLCVLTRWDFNFCVCSSPLRGVKSNTRTHTKHNNNNNINNNNYNNQISIFKFHLFLSDRSISKQVQCTDLLEVRIYQTTIITDLLEVRIYQITIITDLLEVRIYQTAIIPPVHFYNTL